MGKIDPWLLRRVSTILACRAVSARLVPIILNLASAGDAASIAIVAEGGALFPIGIRK